MRQLFIVLGLLVPVMCFAAVPPVTDPAATDPSAKIGDAAMTEFRKNPDAMAKLSPEEYAITQEGATERPFHNRYWNNKEEGLYVDVVSGEPLFSSRQKFDSGSGWPSFTKPLSPTAVTEHKDASHGMIRVEVRSKNADSHLGHVFNDGPREEGGARYCINSGALRFIPKAKLAEEGYGAFLPLFDGPAKK